jgi:hypothetical protein
LEGGTQNEEHKIVATTVEDEMEIHNLGDEFKGVVGEDCMEDFGFDQNAMNDLFN